MIFVYSRFGFIWEEAFSKDVSGKHIIVLPFVPILIERAHILHSPLNQSKENHNDINARSVTTLCYNHKRVSTFNLHVNTYPIYPHAKNCGWGGVRRADERVLTKQALAINVIVGISQTNNSLGVHVLNYKGNTSEPEKKQLISYVFKDVVNHSIQSWWRYKDFGDIITIQIYKDGIGITLSFYCTCIIVLSQNNIILWYKSLQTWSKHVSLIISNELSKRKNIIL